MEMQAPRTHSIRSAGHDVFRAIADPTRRAMLDRLMAGDCAAGELPGARGMSQPALSQHLRVLRRAGLVTQRRVGRRQMVRISPAPLREIVDWVEHYRKFWDDKLVALGTLLDKRKTT
jgi:DNA-binding transcriptional ArsR family regulator